MVPRIVLFIHKNEYDGSAYCQSLPTTSSKHPLVLVVSSKSVLDSIPWWTIWRRSMFGIVFSYEKRLSKKSLFEAAYWRRLDTGTTKRRGQPSRAGFLSVCNHPSCPQPLTTREWGNLLLSRRANALLLLPCRVEKSPSKNWPQKANTMICNECCFVHFRVLSRLTRIGSTHMYTAWYNLDI